MKNVTDYIHRNKKKLLLGIILFVIAATAYFLIDDCLVSGAKEDIAFIHIGRYKTSDKAIINTLYDELYQTKASNQPFSSVAHGDLNIKYGLTIHYTSGKVDIIAALGEKGMLERRRLTENGGYGISVNGKNQRVFDILKTIDFSTWEYVTGE